MPVGKSRERYRRIRFFLNGPQQIRILFETKFLIFRRTDGRPEINAVQAAVELPLGREKPIACPPQNDLAKKYRAYQDEACDDAQCDPGSLLAAVVQDAPQQEERTQRYRKCKNVVVGCRKPERYSAAAKLGCILSRSCGVSVHANGSVLLSSEFCSMEKSYLIAKY
mgnify:FL=1